MIVIANEVVFFLEYVECSTMMLSRGVWSKGWMDLMHHPMRDMKQVCGTSHIVMVRSNHVPCGTKYMVSCELDGDTCSRFSAFSF